MDARCNKTYDCDCPRCLADKSKLQIDDSGMTVDDNGPEITCEPNVFLFCRYCGKDMAPESVKPTSDIGTADILCGDRNLCARPYGHTGNHESFAGETWQ